MQRCARDVALLALNEISTHASDYGRDEQLIFHMITQMQNTDKFVSFAATKAMYSVLISSKELSVHSSALTGLFNDIQAAFSYPSLFVEFRLELISKLLKRFQHDYVKLSEICQLYFEHVQKQWPVLLDLHMNADCYNMAPLVSLTCDILKFKFENDISSDGCLHSFVLSCQNCILDICTHKLVPQLLSYCSNLYEMKKCLGLFTRICASRFLHCGLCCTLMDAVTSSSLVKGILLNWLLLPTHSDDVCYIRKLFSISAISVEVVIDDDDSLLTTVVRKLTLLFIKCLSIMMDGGKGVDWLCRFECACKLSAVGNNHKRYERSLRNTLLEVLLDQDSTMMDAFCYCLKITRIIEKNPSIIVNVLNINLLFIKFLHAISHDHIVLIDYIISEETSCVQFLLCYLEYACENWSAFTSSHYHPDVRTSDITDKVFPLSSRKRKHDHSMSARTDDQPSLVAYDSSDSSEESDPADQSVLHNTMSCIIRLRLALERMLEKQIILNSQQGPAKLVTMIERLETLYETTH